MPYVLKMDAMPSVSSVYRIERQTVWQTCDRENILVLMAAGRCAFEIGTRRLEAGPGQQVYVPAGQDYRRSPLDGAPAAFYYIHFSLPEPPEARSDGELARILTGPEGIGGPAPVPGGGAEALRAYLDEVSDPGEDAEETAKIALKSFEEGGPGGRLACAVCAARLIAAASAGTQRRVLLQNADGPNPPSVPPKLAEAVRYIRLNHMRPLTAAEVSRHAGISRQHLIRLFRSSLGMTPIQFISRTKILHAKELLWRDSSLTVKEVAYELGFQDEHYFSRTFLRTAGETPSAFRRRIRCNSSADGRPR